MHPFLTKRMKIPWPRVGRAIAMLLSIVAIFIALYVLSAPPIIKVIWKAQIRQGQHVGWPRFYNPLLRWGLESDSSMIHGAFEWYFNAVWGCGIGFLDDNPSG
jgi:hypothetical protein